MTKNEKRWYERETPVPKRVEPIELQWFEPAQRLQFVSIRSDPVTGKERPGLCFTVGIRDLRKRPEVVALIEILIEKVKQGQ